MQYVNILNKTEFQARIIFKENYMKISARNLLAGTVEKINAGAVNAEVILKLDGGAQVTSVITLDAMKELGLKVGGKAYAVVKASNVILAVD